MKTIKVWDLFVRFFHWSLVAAILTQLITAEDFQGIHVRVGYFIALLLVLRILWGFIGSRHARFADFIHPPAAVFAYLKGLLTGTAQRFIGHNPAGGAMVVALLVVLSLTATTGLLTYGAEGKGPLILTSGSMVTHALADDDHRAGDGRGANRREEDDSSHARDHVGSGERAHFWKEIHESLVGLLLCMAGLHVCGVAASSYVHRENLVWAMITGRKKI